MFEELSERIREEEGPPDSLAKRFALWAVVVVVSIVLFGGLYLVVQHME